MYFPEGLSPEEALDDAHIEDRLQSICSFGEKYEVLDKRVYRVHQRIVDKYDHGRIILAGDAAHLNSPTGGMGMNGGLHDAFALSSALKKALDGNTESLERYAYVRRQIVNDDIINQAHKNRNRMQTLDISKRREAFDALRSKAENPKLAREHLLKTSMIEGLRRSEELL